MLTTADRSSKNRSLYSSPVGCVSVRSLWVFEDCLFFAELERFGGLPLAKRMPFTATIARTTAPVHPRSKITRVETLKGRKAMKGPFDDHVWQLMHTYGTPFLMLVTMVTTPKVMLCARADRASQSGTSQDCEWTWPFWNPWKTFHEKNVWFKQRKTRRKVVPSLTPFGAARAAVQLTG